MADEELDIVTWQTTGWKWGDWRDFPQQLNENTELRFQAWKNNDKGARWAQYPYTWNSPNRAPTSYVLNFHRMEQQRLNVSLNDWPRPIRRTVVTNAKLPMYAKEDYSAAASSTDAAAYAAAQAPPSATAPAPAGGEATDSASPAATSMTPAL